MFGAAALCVGCFAGEGQPPPTERVYYPTGLALSPGGTRLYVASSDYDLQFNGGALQVLDLARVRQLVREEGAGAPQPCAHLGEQTDAERVLYPGRCRPVKLTAPPGGGSLLLASTGIGAFATDLVYRSSPAGPRGEDRPGGRLFVSVRGDATVTWADVEDDTSASPLGTELDCGQSGARGGSCDAEHRRGDNAAADNTRGLRLPREPYALDATPDGDTLVLTHQTEGALSLLVNDWGSGPSLGTGPRLEFVLGGLPGAPVGVAALPPSPAGEGNFLVTYRNVPQLSLVRFYSDPKAVPARPYLATVGSAPITANASGFDSRGLAVDGTARAQAIADCEPTDEACLLLAHQTKLGLYVANRSPASLLMGETQRSVDLPQSLDARGLSAGPSKVVLADVIDRDGSRRPRVFVVCFDAHVIYVYDPSIQEFETIIETGRGPHALVVDSTEGLGYVGHFTDSYIGVLDLDRRHPTYGTLVLSLGEPSAPRASK